jgi:hypothetical protein
MVLTFFFQTFITGMAFYEMISKCQYYSVLATPANPEILFVRYICISVLHLLMIDNTVNGL